MAKQTVEDMLDLGGEPPLPSAAPEKKDAGVPKLFKKPSKMVIEDDSMVEKPAPTKKAEPPPTPPVQAEIVPADEINEDEILDTVGDDEEVPPPSEDYVGMFVAGPKSGRMEIATKEETPAPPTGPVTAPVPAQPVEKPTAATNDCIAFYKEMEDTTTQSVNMAMKEIGAHLLKDENAKPNDKIVQRALYMARWKPGDLMEMHPKEINAMIVALTAHALYVRAMENKWGARYYVLCREQSTVEIRLRDSQPGLTKKAKEHELLLVNSNVRAMYRACVEAKAMSQALTGMSEVILALADAMKRPSDFRAKELQNANVV